MNLLPETGDHATPPPAAGAYCYYAYGMTIHSDLELPELQPCDSPAADLTVRRQSVPRPFLEDGDSVFEFGETEDYLGYGGVGHFLLPAPGLILFDPAPGTDGSLLGLALLGSVMATFLHRRGLLTMHASAIDVGGRGAIFMGNKGAGKSTTAAAFIAAGHRLLTDDVLPIDSADDGTFRILPGFPQLKLSEAASAVIALPETTVIPITDIGFNKSRLRLAGSFSAQTVPPGVFYVLAPGETFESTPLEGPAALMALMVNAYHGRYGSAVFHGQAAAAHMRRCAAMARAVPVRTLKIPRGLDQLPALVSFVARDMGQT